MNKTRKYIRELKKNEIIRLNKKFHKKVSRQGFLTTKDKEVLLKKSKFQKLDDDELSDVFYNIRERVRSGLRDLNLITETLTEEQLRKIFAEKDDEGRLPVTSFLLSLLPTAKYAQYDKSEDMLLQEEWRKKILFDVVDQALNWYGYSGFIKTEVSKRVINDCRDILAISSSSEINSPYYHTQSLNLS